MLEVDVMLRPMSSRLSFKQRFAFGSKSVNQKKLFGKPATVRGFMLCISIFTAVCHW